MGWSQCPQGGKHEWVREHVGVTTVKNSKGKGFSTNRHVHHCRKCGKVK